MLHCGYMARQSAAVTQVEHSKCLPNSHFMIFPDCVLVKCNQDSCHLLHTHTHTPLYCLSMCLSVCLYVCLSVSVFNHIPTTTSYSYATDRPLISDEWLLTWVVCNQHSALFSTCQSQRMSLHFMSATHSTQLHQSTAQVQKMAFETLWFQNEATYRLSFVNLYKFNDGPLTSRNLV